MTWIHTSIKLAPAQEIFGNYAVISKHELGHYEARLEDGTVLQSSRLTVLCKELLTKLIERGRQP